MEKTAVSCYTVEKSQSSPTEKRCGKGEAFRACHCRPVYAGADSPIRKTFSRFPILKMNFPNSPTGKVPCTGTRILKLPERRPGVLEYQVGKEHIELKAGDSLLVNRNLLHSVRQVSGGLPDPGAHHCLFRHRDRSPKAARSIKNTLHPIADCTSLPFVVFRRQEDWCRESHCLLDEIFTALRQRTDCYEMVVPA